MFAFDSNLKPIVGQQVTLGPAAHGAQQGRLGLLLAQAEAGHCDLVAHSGLRGYLYRGGQFLRDDGSEHPVRALRKPRRPTTLTAVPRGEGYRSGVDRDEDGVLDGVERRQGTDPANPLSH